MENLTPEQQITALQLLLEAKDERLDACIKKIDELKDLNRSLQEKLDSKDQLHQEELGNYNSVAAADMEQRYEDVIEKLIKELKTEQELLISTMGRLPALPFFTIYDKFIHRLIDVKV